MAGMPIRRARKAPITLADGTVVTFPKLTHPRAGLSHAEWRALSPGEKLERLFGMSLERMAEILAWPVAELDPPALALWGRVFHVFMMIAGRKLWREAARERESQEAAERFRRAIERSAARDKA
jgi:hypothetical protein